MSRNSLDAPSACRKPVLFLDTDGIPAEEHRSGDTVRNLIEATLIYQITLVMLALGVSPNAMVRYSVLVELERRSGRNSRSSDRRSKGIISPYRAQLRVIRRMLRGDEAINGSAVEVGTVDKYQGSDKDLILLSWVRSNSLGKVGDLIQDKRRVNVALTRAKHKIIMIGSRRTLVQNELFASCLTLLERNDWVRCWCSSARAVDGRSS